MKTTLKMASLAASMIFTASSAMAGGVSTTAFTYQGRLVDDGLAAEGSYAFVVRLTDETGVQEFGTFCEDVVPVTNGLFTLQLDFGLDVGAPSRFLEISVEKNGDCDDTTNFIELQPRQPITAAPSAVNALRANQAAEAELAIQAESAFRLDAPDGSPTGAVFVDNNGNVGIGTQTPLFPLHVSAPNPILTLRDSDNNDSSQSGILNFANSDNQIRAQIGLTGQNENLRFVNSSAAGNMTFATGTGITRMTIAADGKVGIGTAAPATTLDILGAAGAPTLRLVEQGVAQMLFDGQDINGANGLFLNRGTSQNVILAAGGGNVGIGTVTPASKLHVQGAMQISNSGNQADLLWLSTERSWVFRQEGTGAETALKLESVGGGGNKHFIIQTILSGGVGIARTPAANKFEVEGNASKTTGGSWLTNSDAAIKTNVRTLSNALAVIARLRPVAFRYTEQYKAKHPSVKDQDYYNYIAQEFREVFPEWVKDSGEDGLLQMDEYPAGVYAVAAIQELHSIVQDKTCEIDDLVERERGKAHRLTELEWQNAELQTRVARLEALLEASNFQQRGTGGKR